MRINTEYCYPMAEFAGHENRSQSSSTLKELLRERGTLMDISQRKQAELDAARQRNEMAHLSRVTMLGELSSSIAHELNQPLASILSNAQAAQRFLAGDDVDLGGKRNSQRHRKRRQTRWRSNPPLAPVTKKRGSATVLRC